MNYNSGHSKLIKNGIALSCLRASLTRSCSDSVCEAFHGQVSRLKEAGFPGTTLRMTADKLVRLLKKQGGAGQAGSSRERSEKFAVLPYVHRMSHGLKKVAARFGVDVVFSSPVKLNSVCPAVQRRAEYEPGKKKSACVVNHVSPFVPCSVAVVYKIPLSCGKVYVGQTGRCLNVRLLEHRNKLKKDDYARLAEHCRTCEHRCYPLFRETDILFKHKDRRTRELMESYYIRKWGRDCISETSVVLHEKEFGYLERSSR